MSFVKTIALFVFVGMLFAGCSFKAEVGTGMFGSSSQGAGHSTVLTSCGSER